MTRSVDPTGAGAPSPGSVVAARWPAVLPSRAVLPSTRVGALVLVAVAAGYLLAPDGLGGTVETLVNAGLLLLVAVGPLLRDVRPRRVWFLAALAGVLLVASTLDAIEPLTSWRAGPFEYSDVTFLAAYMVLLAWLALLTRLVSDKDRSALLDTAAACVGAVLAVWTTILAQLSTADDLVTGIVWAAYPPLDVAMLAFAVRLAIALRRVPVALRWLMAGFLLWLLGDSIYAVQQVHLAESYDVPALEVVYLAAHACLARGMTHPRLRELSPPPQDRVRSSTLGRRVAVVLFTVLPAILASGITEVDTVDVIVRTTLLAVLLGLLFVRITRTMTALAEARAESHWRATHDPLTGLLNRAALFDEVERRLRRDAATGASTVVLFFDCDDFKRVNDTWGHLAGDMLLVDLAGRLPRCLGPDERCSRNGGDEFVVVASVTDEAQAHDLGRRVRSVFDAPLRVRTDRVHPMTPSIGIALASPSEGCTTEELLGRADAAMYAGKQQGKARTVFFGEDLAGLTRTRAAIGDRLGQVIAEGPCDVVLQPIMAGPGLGRRWGWEVFARWHDEVLGDVPPEEFVPVAEQLGLLGTLGAGVLRRACHDLVRLRAAYPGEELRVSVNVSPSELRDPDFAAAVVATLAETDLPPGSLHLELTEGALTDVLHAADVLAELRRAGVHVAVDHFGAGYASLGMLTRLPIDGVKVDRSFVEGIAEDPAARERLAAVIALLRTLGIRDVVATGVETPAQERVLLEMGCPAAQGRLYGLEVSLEEVLAEAWPGEGSPAAGVGEGRVWAAAAQAVDVAAAVAALTPRSVGEVAGG